MPVLQTTVSQWFTSLTQNIFRAGTPKHLAISRGRARCFGAPQHDNSPTPRVMSGLLLHQLRFQLNRRGAERLRNRAAGLGLLGGFLKSLLVDARDRTFSLKLD